MWLGPEDHPWIVALLDELRRCAGEPTRVWVERAAEPLRAPAPPRRLRLVVDTLTELCTPTIPRARARTANKPSAKTETSAEQPLHPRDLRATLFDLAAAQRHAAWDRELVVSTAARTLGIAPEVLLDQLYADLPMERPLRLPDPLPDAAAITRITNQHLARSVLASSSRVEIVLSSRSRALVRQILLKKLLVTVRPAGEGMRVEVSGPFALFRHTTLYGGALASLLGVLRGVDQFVVRAVVKVGGRAEVIGIQQGDPVFPPGAEPKPFDSRVEARFAREVQKRLPDWDVVREPEPVSVSGTWIFPDFGLVHRRDRRRWLVEIVGYWTAEYLAHKIERLRRSGRGDILVLVDEKLACGAGDFPSQPHVLLFRGRVDVEAVAEVVERAAAPPRPSTTPNEPAIEIRAADLWADYAGRKAAGEPIHAALLTLRVGDPVYLVERETWLVLTNTAGVVVAVVSNRAREALRARPGGVEAIDGLTVSRLVERTREDCHPDWRERIMVARWWVPEVAGVSRGVVGT